MNIFDQAKQAVSAEEAARMYGLNPDRHGRILCPFHNDHDPSMKVYPEDRGYYCFSCHAAGSVIDLVMQLFDLPPVDAAKKILKDAGLPCDDIIPAAKPKASPEKLYSQKLEHYTQVMLDYLLMLEKWLEGGPKTADEEPSSQYLEAIKYHDRIQYISEMLLQGDPVSRAEIIIFHESELQEHEKRFNKVTTGAAADVSREA